MPSLRRVGLLSHPDLHILSRQGASGAPWQEIVRAAIAKCEEIGAWLMILDTFLPFAGLRGDAENSAGAILEALEPLLDATAKDIAVIVSRHERKAQGEVGSSGRGSNAFTGAVDTVITIRRVQGGGNANVRVLSGISRLDGIPSKLTVSLEGDGFVVVDSSQHKLDEAAGAILQVAPATEEDASRLETIADAAAVSRTVAQKAVEHLIAHGQIRQVGKGVRGNPHRFWAPRDPNDSFRPESTPKGGRNESEEGEASDRAEE